MKFKIFPLLLAIFGLQSFAQELPEGVEHIQTLDNVEEYRLRSNGMGILLMPNEVLPVATVMVTYKVGARNEVAGTTGATHILEHMMFKGTDRFNGEDGTHGDDYFREMERVGARSNATTWFDRTNYYANLPSQYVPMTIEIEADRMRNLRLRKQDLDSEMTVVRNEYERGENSPVSTLLKDLFATAFVAHPYSHPTIGWRSDIESTSIEKLRNFYDIYYWPENAYITIIGGFDKAETLAAIAQYYGEVPAAPKAIPTVETIEPQQMGPRRVTIRRAGQTGVVMIGYKVPEGSHEDWAALSLLQQILGADKTGRLYRALEDKGKSNATFTFGPQLRDPGLFIFGSYLTPEATHEEVETIILDEIARIISSGVAEDELARAKSVIKASTFYGRDGPYQIADQINEAIAMGDWTSYVKLPKAIQSVTADQIKTVAAKYFLEDSSTTGWFVPEVVNTLTASQQSKMGIQYFRDPEVYGSLSNQAAERSSAHAVPSQSIVDFSSQMKRAKIGPIELLAIDMPIEGVVSFVGSIAAGDSLSPQDKPMLASLTASMLDKGTTHADRFQIAEQLDTLGADIGFSSGPRSLSFSGRFLRADAGPIMELLSDQLRNPAFPSEVLETLKSRQKAGLLQAIDNPDYRADSQVSRLLYPKNHVNYNTPIETLIKDLEDTRAEDLVTFHKEHYGSESMLLVFAGDIDFEQLKAAVGNAFEGWEGGRAYNDLETNQLENRKLSDRIYIEDKTSVAVRLAYNTQLQRASEDYLPFMIGNYILGGSFQSRLMTEVRKNRGLTYSIRSSHVGDIFTPGNWSLSVSLAPSLFEEGLAATYGVLEDWYNSGVSEKEVARAIETLKGSYLVNLSTTNTVAGQLHSFVQRGFEPEYIDEYPMQLRGITAEQVNHSIRNYFDPNTLIEVAAGSLTGAAKAEDPAPNTTPISVRLDAPNPGWSIQIEKVYLTQESIIAISKLTKSEDMAAQVISTVSDTIEIDTIDHTRPIKHYIIGKTWNWGEIGDYTHIENMGALDNSLQEAKLLFSHEK